MSRNNSVYSSPPPPPPLAPPSAPRDLASTTLSADGRLQLSWSPPLVTGGRRDICYSVVCERCAGALCVPCGEKVRFQPGPTDLQDTVVTVGELEPHLNYTFTVEARSGVSQYSNQRPSSTITTALHFTDPPKVTSIRLDERSTTSLSLSWALSRRAPSHVNHRYELMYRRKVRQTTTLLPLSSLHVSHTLNTTYI